jgi:hypothetical protein
MQNIEPWLSVETFDPCEWTASKHSTIAFFPHQKTCGNDQDPRGATLQTTIESAAPTAEITSRQYVHLKSTVQLVRIEELIHASWYKQPTKNLSPKAKNVCPETKFDF